MASLIPRPSPSFLSLTIRPSPSFPSLAVWLLQATEAGHVRLLQATEAGWGPRNEVILRIDSLRVLAFELQLLQFLTLQTCNTCLRHDQGYVF